MGEHKSNAGHIDCTTGDHDDDGDEFSFARPRRLVVRFPNPLATFKSVGESD